MFKSAGIWLLWRVSDTGGILSSLWENLCDCLGPWVSIPRASPKSEVQNDHKSLRATESGKRLRTKSQCREAVTRTHSVLQSRTFGKGRQKWKRNCHLLTVSITDVTAFGLYKPLSQTRQLKPEMLSDLLITQRANTLAQVRSRVQVVSLSPCVFFLPTCALGNLGPWVKWDYGISS